MDEAGETKEPSAIYWKFPVALRRGLGTHHLRLLRSERLARGTNIGSRNKSASSRMQNRNIWRGGVVLFQWPLEPLFGTRTPVRRMLPL